jgi:hypothetical protein
MPPPVARDQVDRERVLGDADLRRGVDRGHQRPLDLRAGRVTARVRDPVAKMAALAGQRQLAAGRVVEVGPQRDQLPDRRLGPR